MSAWICGPRSSGLAPMAPSTQPQFGEKADEAPLVVAASRPRLMSAAPNGPPESVLRRQRATPDQPAQEPPDQPAQEPPDLRRRRRQEIGAQAGPSCSVPVDVRAGDGEQRMRQEAEGDLAMPPVPAPDVVLVEATLPIGRLEGVFARPAPAGHPHKIDGGCGGRSVADVVRRIARIGAAAARPQPVAATRIRPRPDRRPRSTSATSGPAAPPRPAPDRAGSRPPAARP